MKSQQFGCLNKTSLMTIPVDLQGVWRKPNGVPTIDEELQAINNCIEMEN